MRLRTASAFLGEIPSGNSCEIPPIDKTLGAFPATPGIGVGSNFGTKSSCAMLGPIKSKVATPAPTKMRVMSILKFLLISDAVRAGLFGLQKIASSFIVTSLAHPRPRTGPRHAGELGRLSSHDSACSAVLVSLLLHATVTCSDCWS